MMCTRPKYDNPCDPEKKKRESKLNFYLDLIEKLYTDVGLKHESVIS